MKGLLYVLPYLIFLSQSALTQVSDPVNSWIKEGDAEKIESYLLDHDINERHGQSGMTLLVNSILHGPAPTTKLFVQNGSDVNMFVGGISPLMYAAASSDVAKVSLIMDAGADKEAEDHEGNTALYYAASSGNIKITRFLVRNGVNLHHKNNTQQTPYDMAVQTRKQEVAKFLREEAQRNLPDLLDGPYIKWAGKKKIKAFYMVHDSNSGITRRSKSNFKADSDPYLIQGFATDSMDYLVHSQKGISPDLTDEAELVMVIGDIHGGYDSLVVFLQNNNVIDRSMNWIWGSGHLVFVGDIFDRGDKVTEALWLIYRIETQASETGGAVHLILGNHELMVLEGDLNYVASKYLLMSERLNLDYSLFFGKKTVLGQWLRTKNTIIRINGYMFVHAGLSPAILEAGLTMHEINDHVRYFINHPDRKDYEGVNRNTLLGPNGPFWYRGYLKNNHQYDHLAEDDLEKVLEYFDADRIFIGHTNVEEITPLYSNRVFAIDVPFYSHKHSMYGLLLNAGDVFLLNTSAEKKQIN